MVVSYFEYFLISSVSFAGICFWNVCMLLSDRTSVDVNVFGWTKEYCVGSLYIKGPCSIK